MEEIRKEHAKEKGSVFMKSNHKRLFSLLLAGSMMFGLAACGDKNGSSASGKNSSSEPSGEPLVVGVQSSLISAPTVYAKEKGYFDELGLNVELVMFPNGSPENEGLAAEQLDIASNGLASVFPVSSGLCAFVAETDTIGKSTWIMARPDNPVFDKQGEIAEYPEMYGSKDALKGQTILGATSTISHHMAAAYMSRFGLEAGADYEFLNMDNSAAVQAFLAGEGDMIATADFNLLEQLEAGGAKRVASYQDATGGDFLNGIVARYDVLEERRADVVLFLKGMYRAAEELQNDLDLRVKYWCKFYSENGKEASEEAFRQEAETRIYVTPEYMKSDDYVMGSGLVGTGVFFASIGTIDEDQAENVKKGIDGSLIEDALGITVKTAK